MEFLVKYGSERLQSMTYHWVWGKESPGDSVEVGEGELDACVGESQLMDVG